MMPENTTQPHGVPCFICVARKMRTSPPTISAMPSIRVSRAAAWNGFCRQMKPAKT